MIWQDRLLKVEDNCLLMSAKGRHDDFDFDPEHYKGDMACAIGFVESAAVYPDGRLIVSMTDGRHRELTSGDLDVATFHEVKP